MSLEAANAAAGPYYGAPRWNPHRRRPAAARGCWRWLAGWARCRTRPAARTRRRRCPPPSALVGWQVDAVDAWWASSGARIPFTLVEMGAGDGTRAAAFLAAGPECLTALRYVLVEDDPARRDQQRAHLPIESPDPRARARSDRRPGGRRRRRRDRGAGRAVAGIGPLITSLAEPPVVDGAGRRGGIGWVSRLPSDRLEWRDGRWWEIRLAAGTDDGDAVGARRSRSTETRGRRRAEQLAGADATAPPPRPDGARYALLGPGGRLAGPHPAGGRVGPAGSRRPLDRRDPPAGAGEAPPLALDQLAAVRRPIEPAPAVSFSRTVAVVSWRLG